MGGLFLIERQPKRSAVATIVVLGLIAAMLVSATPSSAEPYDVTDDPAMCVTGQTMEALAGRSVAFLDIDHDGIGDLVVGAPGDDSAGMSSGKVMIYLGDEIKSDPDIEISGSAGERFGFAVARAGDVNSDGIDDLIVGAPGNDTGGIDAGAAYIILGSEDIDDLPERAWDADVVIEGEDARGGLGYSVSTAGDADLDGIDDVLVGIPFAGAGMVDLLYGGSSMDGVTDKTFTGSATGDWFGFSLAGGMNLDGSARPDAVVGAPMSSEKTGEVQIILDPAKAAPKVVTLTGAAEGDEFGASVAVLDFNGDIYGDVAVGAPKAESVGEVTLFYGSALSGKFDGVSDVMFSVGQTGDWFGFSVAGGDPRTDDVGDLVVGAPLNDSAGVDAGRVYVFYGNETADSEHDVIVEGLETGSRFGFCVATGGSASADYSDDNAADFAAGAPYSGDDSEGAAYLYLGILIITPANPEIYGYLLDAVTGEGIGDALVKMESPAYSRSVRTTTNGSYGLTTAISLPTGTYWVNASHDGYLTGSAQHVLASDTRTNVSFDLDRLPVVQGVISDGNATGSLEDALVEVRDAAETLLDSSTTDATGEYYFVVEVEGDITITVTKDYYFDGVIDLALAGNDDITEDLTLDHYPILLITAEDTDGDPIEGVDLSVEIGGELLATGETDASGEETIMVRGTGPAFVNSTRAGYVPDNSGPIDLIANEMESLDIVMDRQPSIYGTIKDDLLEAPVSGAVVDLFVSGSTDVLESETSDSYGSYVFDVVEEGTYDLKVTVTGYLVQYRLDVDVVADEASVVDFWLASDTVPPTSEISDPQPGLLCTTPEVYVHANATDPDGNDILSVALYYSHDGEPYLQWGTADYDAPYVFEFNASEANGDGIYEFYTIALDSAGNEQLTPAKNDTWIIMNSDLPVSEVDALDTYQSEDLFTVSVSGSDPFDVESVELWYSYEGMAFELYGQDDTAPYSWEFTAADGDGEYAFYSILVNGIGQTELPPDEPDASTVLDTTDPTTTISHPVDDSDLDTGVFELGAHVSDDGAGLDYLGYSVDSNDEVLVEIADGQAAYDLAVELDLEDGEHSIVVTAMDILGWQSSDEVTFRVDTTSPSLTILHPSDGTAVNTTNVEVSWTAEDALTGIALTEMRMGSGAWETVVGTSELYEDLDDDVYNVDVRVTDGAGNTATATTTFEVDTIAPTVSITYPVTGSSLGTSSVNVTWTASGGTGSDIDVIEVKMDDGAWVTGAGGSHEFTGLSEGAHSASVRATDGAGNAAVQSVSFMVDTASPSLSITSPDEGLETDSRSVTVTWTCDDVGCGIDRIEVCLDDGTYVSVGTVSEHSFEDLDVGGHTVDVRVYDKAGNTAEASVTFAVTEGGGISALLIGALVIAFVVLAAVAVMLMRRKKEGTPPMVE
jgi:hypothetical protein